jgi:hypothetical protein
MTNIKIIFPKITSSLNFPNVLNIGKTDNILKKNSNNKVLIILDTTGSMGEFINNKDKYSKAKATKMILEKIASRGFELDILPFNKEVFPICKIEQIPDPDNSTYMTPLVPEVDKILKLGTNYTSIIFISDGLPTEPKELAHQAIKQIGQMVREFKSNPISIAIGSDADGPACALFSGNRGFECFFKYISQMDELIEDIINGINCNYIQLENGEYIPVEKSGNYYYLDSDLITPISNDISIEMLMKYINLAILEEFSKMYPNYNELQNFVNKVSEVITNKPNREMVINHFNKIIGHVYNTTLEQNGTPSLMSARKQAYRYESQQI